MTIYDDTIKLYKVCVAENSDRPDEFDSTFINLGVVTDFLVTTHQAHAITRHFSPVKLNTLFTVEERNSKSYSELIYKQLLHYVEVYGLNDPGCFDLFSTDGEEKVTFTFIKGVTLSELNELVKSQLYSNRPVNDVDALERIIKHYDLSFDVNKIQNNEMKIRLFDLSNHTFEDGDDAVRYIVYNATGSTLLVKSKEVVNAIGSCTVDNRFLEKHRMPLANVFNRHKKIILACKHGKNRPIINEISRLSKKHHVPMRESISKSFITKTLNGEIRGEDVDLVLHKISMRDKLKFINLLEFKLKDPKHDVFMIRNGKTWTKMIGHTWSKESMIDLQNKILRHVETELTYLKNKKILLDSEIDYGVPVSAKQLLGNLPFGTRFSPNTDKISVGIYWHENGGAVDLDLSTINSAGQRIGWGHCAGYNNKDIVFSGDVTSAYDGAMEFFTCGKESFGLFVNIYTGSIGCKCDLVVGTQKTKSKKWIDNVFIRESTTLKSRGSILGFVENGDFVVWAGRLNDNVASFCDGTNNPNPVLEKGKSSIITVRTLFEAIGIEYDTEQKPDVEYDFDLRYSNFTIDKLEKMFYPV